MTDLNVTVETPMGMSLNLELIRQNLVPAFDLGCQAFLARQPPKKRGAALSKILRESHIEENFLIEGGMANLKVYVDLMSQPSRAVTLFLRLNNIKHDLNFVQIRKGEHLNADYVSKVHKFGRVPAIVDSDFKLIESIAILRYLSANCPIADHWYPKDPKLQAKVDEFLEWQHLGLRLPLSMFFQTKFIRPLMSGTPAKPELVEFWKGKMEDALDQVENIWLEKNRYLVGNVISAADLIGLCEIDQPRMGGYEPSDGRPKLKAWLDRVRKETQPHYNDVTKLLNHVIEKFKGQPPSDISKL